MAVCAFGILPIVANMVWLLVPYDLKRMVVMSNIAANAFYLV